MSETPVGPPTPPVPEEPDVPAPPPVGAGLPPPPPPPKAPGAPFIKTRWGFLVIGLVVGGLIGGAIGSSAGGKTSGAAPVTAFSTFVLVRRSRTSRGEYDNHMAAPDEGRVAICAALWVAARLEAATSQVGQESKLTLQRPVDRP